MRPPSFRAGRLGILVSTLMTRWTAAFGWAASMLVVWTLFVPGGLSAVSFALLCAAGPLVFVAGALFWRAQQPSPSIRQIRATLDAKARPPTAG